MAMTIRISMRSNNRRLCQLAAAFRANDVKATLTVTP